MLEWKKLGEVCKILNGYSFKSNEYVPDGVRVIRISDVQSGHISDGDRVFYPKEKQVEYERFLLKSGDLVMSLTGNPGRVAFIKQDHIPCALNQRVACLRVTNVNCSYLFYLFNCKEFESIAFANSSGGAQKNLSTTWLNNYKIPVPSIAEQTRIVGILDTFTAAIDNLQHQIDQRRKQYEHYRDQLLDLEGKEGVEMKTLGMISKRNKGIPITAGKMSELASADGNVRVFAAGQTKADINEALLPLNCAHRKPSVIIKSRGFVDFEYYDKPFTHKNEMWSYSSEDKVLIRYIYFFLSTKVDFFRKKAKANSVKLPQLCVADTDDYCIPVPMALEQQRIVSILDTFEQSIANLEQQLAQREKQYEFYRNKLLTFE